MKCRIPSLRTAVMGAFAVALSCGSPLGAQRSDVPEDPMERAEAAVPSDTYGDAEVERTLRRAFEARRRTVTGIESYEARIWERIQVGLTGASFRRDRGLWTEERAARVRWEEGERAIRWEGAVRAFPVAGLRSDQDSGLAESLQESLSELTGWISPALYAPGYTPGDDRIVFGGERGALHPVSDTAGVHYRFSTGDTLRLTLPPDGRRIDLVEVRVEPRQTISTLVAGSFWFEEDGGQLVRASYRPAGPHYLAERSEDGEEPRGLARSFQAEIQHVTVDYGLHHMQWWLPHRMSLAVEVRAGDLLQLPLQAEWRMDEYRVNEPRSVVFDPAELPEGWEERVSMRPLLLGTDVDSDSVRIVTLVPPSDRLHLSTELTLTGEGRLLAPGLVGFSDGELRQLRDDIGRILPPSAVLAPRLAWGVEEGLLRYNRVEGLSLGVAGEAPLGRGRSARLEVRAGTSDRAPLGELRFQRGADSRREAVAVYRRLSHSSDWGNPFTLSSSLATFVTGRDDGEYFRTTGIELIVFRNELPGSPEARLFVETHDSVERTTSFHLAGLFGGGSLRANRPVREGTWSGGALSLRGSRSASPGALELFGRSRMEAAWRDEASYRRLLLSGGVSRELGPLAVGLEVGAGAGWGALPPQREFHLAGSSTVRGVAPGSIVGESHWFARAELSRGTPAARFVLFSDLGWAGARTDWGSGRPVRTAGIGFSLLDGLIRLDLARPIESGRSWRGHLYLDGIL